MTEVEKWLNHISAYDREFAQWEKRSKKIIERYTDQRGHGDIGAPGKGYRID